MRKHPHFKCFEHAAAVATIKLEEMYRFLVHQRGTIEGAYHSMFAIGPHVVESSIADFMREWVDANYRQSKRGSSEPDIFHITNFNYCFESRTTFSRNTPTIMGSAKEAVRGKNKDRVGCMLYSAYELDPLKPRVVLRELKFGFITPDDWSVDKNKTRAYMSAASKERCFTTIFPTE